ncbi:MAG: hypothetical protein IPN76_10725 [Saprospiraceae bacterium]|nr:hypothetical protein [Saprospiraceae bacterium]
MKPIPNSINFPVGKWLLTISAIFLLATCQVTRPPQRLPNPTELEFAIQQAPIRKALTLACEANSPDAFYYFIKHHASGKYERRAIRKLNAWKPQALQELQWAKSNAEQYDSIWDTRKEYTVLANILDGMYKGIFLEADKVGGWEAFCSSDPNVNFQAAVLYLNEYPKGVFKVEMAKIMEAQVASLDGDGIVDKGKDYPSYKVDSENDDYPNSDTKPQSGEIQAGNEATPESKVKTTNQKSSKNKTEDDKSGDLNPKKKKSVEKNLDQVATPPMGMSRYEPNPVELEIGKGINFTVTVFPDTVGLKSSGNTSKEAFKIGKYMKAELIFDVSKFTISSSTEDANDNWQEIDFPRETKWTWLVTAKDNTDPANDYQWHYKLYRTDTLDKSHTQGKRLY